MWHQRNSEINESNAASKNAVCMAANNNGENVYAAKRVPATIAKKEKTQK